MGSCGGSCSGGGRGCSGGGGGVVGGLGGEGPPFVLFWDIHFWGRGWVQVFSVFRCSGVGRKLLVTFFLRESELAPGEDLEGVHEREGWWVHVGGVVQVEGGGGGGGGVIPNGYPKKVYLAPNIYSF